MSLSAGTRFGPYEIVSPLGAGGMGEVYRAKDSRLGRDVAIKVLPAGFAADGERLKRFELEAKATSALNHPNILTVFDIGNHDGAPFLVAELLEGETLREKLTGPIPPRKSVEWAIQMAHGLAAAHEKGIVHRDLKPENLFITKDNRLKILDFGLAKQTGPVGPQAGGDDTPTRSVGTAAGVVMGTVGYMSPEQVRGEPVDARSDIFAFGTILYEMISGKRAFKGNSAVETMSAILNAEPPEFPPLDPASPPGLERLVRHSLEKSPDHRFQSARDLAFQLETLSEISGINLAAHPEPRGSASERCLIRSLILPPDKTKFELDELNAASLVISPDGRKLVFVAETQDHKKPLWIRPLDSLNAQPLTGTDGAIHPFWSPDASHIGFFSDGKLKKIAVNGWQITTLSDAPEGGGGSWSHDNLILFIPRRAGPIHQIPASGGTATPVIRPPMEGRETPHQWPVFLPDGRHYLYTRRGGGDQLTTAIFAASLDGKTNRFLLETHSNALYASGHLLYLRGEALVAQPFDLERLQIHGDPAVIADSVKKAFPMSWGIFSVSRNGLLVYRSRNTDDDNELQLAWHDRSGKCTGLLGKPAAYFTLEISPDGRRVATVIQEKGKRDSDLWIFDVARGMKTRLTFDTGAKCFPVWSPDSRQIVFQAIKPEQFELNVISADGSGAAIRLLGSKNHMLPADWSPDGRMILYYEADTMDHSKWCLWGLPLDGERKPVQILPLGFAKFDARFSPDGKWIAYLSEMSDGNEIYLTPYPGPGGKTLVAADGSDQPYWRKDGKGLIFVQQDRRLMETEIEISEDALQVGETRQLFADPIRWSRGMDVSENGDRILLALLPYALTTETTPAIPQPVTLVVNWDAELKK